MFDLAVIGGGIIGVATAYRLKRIYPDFRMVLIEKERELAFHQTGHNSGVIHSGIYYLPGSLQAKTAVRGSHLLKEFCKKYKIPFKITGKLIVATRENELFLLQNLYQRGKKNGVKGLIILPQDKLKEMEPNVRGIRAIYVPGTGIVDYKKVTEKLAELFQKEGGKIMFSTCLKNIKYESNSLILETTKGEIRTRYLVTCAGLHADRVAKMGGRTPCMKIVPFRGEYYKIKRKNIVNKLIYPVPDPRYPFLGIHITKKLNGETEAGPNAVLAFSREGYSRTEISWKDLSETLTYPGFWSLFLRNWTTGIKELSKTFSKRVFFNGLKKLISGVEMNDLEKGGAGIRAQALSPRGTLIDDFVFLIQPKIIHVCNAPSPAATASLAIAERISKMVEEKFEIKGKTRGKIWF